MKREYTWLDFYVFSVYLGLRSILKGRSRKKFIFERIFVPLDYWRYIEFPVVVNSLDVNSSHKVLDLSSPKLPHLFIYLKKKCIMYATDILNDFIGEYDFFLNVLNLKNELNKSIFYQTEDGRKLSFPDNYFDRIYLISMLEHIPDNGDTLTMKELWRVLKKGGLLSVTVPYSPTYHESFVARDVFERKSNGNRIFWARLYDEPSLKSRIITPSNLRLLKKEYFGETKFNFYQLLMSTSKIMRRIIYPFYPILARLFIKKMNMQEVKSQSLVHLLFRRE